MSTDEFLKQIEDFLVEHDMSHTAFGKMVVHDASFVSRLRKGSDVKLRTVEKILQWMEQHKETASSEAAA